MTSLSRRPKSLLFGGASGIGWPVNDVSMEYVLYGLGVIGALIAIIYWSLRSADAKLETELDKHIEQDTVMHERLVKVETKVEKLEVESEKVREMRHEVIEKVSSSLASYYTNTMEKVREMIDKLRP